MPFDVQFSNHWDTELKIQKQKIECFSPNYLKNTYPRGGCKVLGEVSGKKFQRSFGTIQIGSTVCDVAPIGKHPSLFWRKAGYLPVGNDEYIVLLKSRVPFLLLFSALLFLIAVMLMLLLPRPEPNIPTPDASTSQGPGDISGVPDKSDTPVTPPDTPDEPDTPVTPPDTPDEPDTPVTPPDTPDEPDTPVTPPDTPDKPDTPEVPDEPKQPEVIVPDHPLPPVDENSKPLEDDKTEKPSGNTGGGSLSMIYTLKATIDLSDKSIGIYFKNPNASTHNVTLDFYLVSGEKEYLVAKSGLLEAGYGLNTLTLSDDAPTLSEGIYTGIYRLHCYDPITGERALVAPSIAGVEVTVQK